MSLTRARQFEAWNWARNTFGSVALLRSERAARLIEEALELVQAEQLPRALVDKIADRVYSRPQGSVPQEIGGLAITLDVLAENIGIDVQVEAERELTRVLSLPPEFFQRKHAEKIAAGTAN